MKVFLARVGGNCKKLQTNDASVRIFLLSHLKWKFFSMEKHERRKKIVFKWTIKETSAFFFHLMKRDPTPPHFFKYLRQSLKVVEKFERFFVKNKIAFYLSILFLFDVAWCPIFPRTCFLTFTSELCKQKTSEKHQKTRLCENSNCFPVITT